MKKVNNFLIFVFSLLAICFFVRDFNVGRSDRLLGDISLPLVLCMPKIINKIFKFNLSSYLEMIYIIFIIIAQFLGSIVNLYNTVWWYDLFAHFISGVLTGVLALIVLNWFKKYNYNDKFFNILFIISFVLMVASIWEFLEYGTDKFMNLNVQHSIETGVSDTMEDMLIAFLGSILVSLKLLAEKKNGFINKIINHSK